MTLHMPSQHPVSTQRCQGLWYSLATAQPAVGGRSPHLSFPPAWPSGALSAARVLSKSMSYISQDPLQSRYHLTEFQSTDCVGSDVNDFQDYSRKTTPRDPYFSFPVCQLGAEGSAETSGPLADGRPTGVRSHGSTRHLILQSLCMWLGHLRVVRLLIYGGWLLRSQCSKRPRGELQGFF